MCVGIVNEVNDAVRFVTCGHMSFRQMGILLQSLARNIVHESSGLLTIRPSVWGKGHYLKERKTSTLVGNVPCQHLGLKFQSLSGCVDRVAHVAAGVIPLHSKHKSDVCASTQVCNELSCELWNVRLYFSLLPSSYSMLRITVLNTVHNAVENVVN